MRFTFITLLFLLTLGCASEKSKLTVEESKMVAIIKDLHVAEELVSRFREEDKDSVRTLYRNDISKIHDISLEEIERNLAILQNEPTLGHQIYTKAYQDLNDAYKNLDAKK